MNPWEKYAQPEAGPWAKYAAPTLADIPLAPGAAERMAAEAAALPQKSKDKTWRDDSIGDMLYAPAETVMSLGSAVGMGAIAPVVGFAKATLNPNSAKQPQEYASEFAQDHTYVPRSGTAQQIVGLAGQALAPLGTLPTAELGNIGNAVASAKTAARGRIVAPVQDLIRRTNAPIAAADAALVQGVKPLSLLPKKSAPLAGVGAASTPEATIRAQRAASMPVPVPMTRGQLTRDFQQVQFEREAAKMPEGKPLNDLYGQQNAIMGQIMDAFGDQTGGQASSLRATGKSVVDAAAMKKTAKKQAIKSDYTLAREAGDMSAPVDPSAIASYIEKNRAAMRNAPILATADDEITRLSNGGVISVNDMEELRKMVGKAGKPNSSNANAGYTPDLIRLIDQTTEGKGGPLYQQARRNFENYSKEFTDRAVVDKLLRDKPGTKDRSVPYEDVMKHTLLNGSLDDTKHLFRVLEAHPAGTDPAIVAAGQQAAKDLRGSLVNHMKEQMFSNAGADSLGNVVGSEAKIKRIINELDKDGKLEAIYGRQGAQQLRDVRDLATDLYTSPNGTVNTSNTASAAAKIMNKFAGIAGGTPVIGHAVKYTAKQIESAAMRKKVSQAITPLDKLPRKRQ